MNNINSNKKELSPEQLEELLSALKARFEKNMNRHIGLEWAKVQAKLDRRYGNVFVYHNSAPSYIALRRSVAR